MSNRDNMLDKLSSKLSDRLTHRADMYVADAQIISADTAKLVIAYDKDIASKIDSQQIINYVRQEFDGLVVPSMQTAKLHNKEGAVTVLASLYRPTRPIEDAQDLVEVISGTQFLDSELGQTWEVREEEGQKYLIRSTKDNIEDIIKERRRRMSIQARTVTATDLSAGIPNLNVKDVVRYYDGGKILKGTVSNMTGTHVTVDGKSVDKHAVIEICQTSPITTKTQQTEMQEYFSKAYGDPNYVKPMTSKPSVKVQCAVEETSDEAPKSEEEPAKGEDEEKLSSEEEPAAAAEDSEDKELKVAQACLKILQGK